MWTPSCEPTGIPKPVVGVLPRPCGLGSHVRKGLAAATHPVGYLQFVPRSSTNTMLSGIIRLCRDQTRRCGVQWRRESCPRRPPPAPPWNFSAQRSGTGTLKGLKRKRAARPGSPSVFWNVSLPRAGCVPPVSTTDPLNLELCSFGRPGCGLCRPRRQCQRGAEVRGSAGCSGRWCE